MINDKNNFKRAPYIESLKFKFFEMQRMDRNITKDMEKNFEEKISNDHSKKSKKKIIIQLCKIMKV